MFGADSILNAALRYYEDFGWCIIPVPQAQKAATIRWGHYQKVRPDRAQVQKWFTSRKRNIGVVLGEVSGGLCCRDFDTVESYGAWAKAHPELAELLPTAKTARGFHVYFCGQVESIRHLDDGELRGAGGYCLLPPSLHPNGTFYEWIREPSSENLLVIDNLQKAGFAPKNANVTERTERTEKTDEDPRDKGKGEVSEPLADAIEMDEKIEAAIDRTLPQEHGTRHRRIFDFARALKSIPEYADADPRVFRAAVQEWHRRALPNIRTREFEETWVDFLKGWPKVKYKLGEGPMAEIFERAVTLGPPAVAVARYPGHQQLQLLAALCRELQKAAGDGAFFLSCRTAAGLISVSPMQISRWLFLLESDGILQTVVKDGARQSPRRASRFRYLPGRENLDD